VGIIAVSLVPVAYEIFKYYKDLQEQNKPKKKR
jgi:hypothetical protein